MPSCSRTQGPLKAGVDLLADHGALELGKSARDLKLQTWTTRRGALASAAIAGS